MCGNCWNQADIIILIIGVYYSSLDNNSDRLASMRPEGIYRMMVQLESLNVVVSSVIGGLVR